MIAKRKKRVWCILEFSKKKLAAKLTPHIIYFPLRLPVPSPSFYSILYLVFVFFMPDPIYPKPRYADT